MYSIVIQAGGKSSRMGEDKSLIYMHGKPLIKVVIDKVRPLGEELIITCNEPQKLEEFNAKVVKDEYPDVGALAGIHAGIKAASNDLVIVVATDMPFVNVGLLNYMKSLMTPEVDVVVPVSEKGYEPLHAIYRKSSCLPAIELAIMKKQRRIISWFEAVKVVTIDKTEIEKFDRPGLAFFNINTPEDLMIAEGLFNHPEDDAI